MRRKFSNTSANISTSDLNINCGNQPYSNNIYYQHFLQNCNYKLIYVYLSIYHKIFHEMEMGMNIYQMSSCNHMDRRFFCKSISKLSLLHSTNFSGFNFDDNVSKLALINLNLSINLISFFVIYPYMF